MESKTKSRLTPDVINTLVKLHFPEAHITSIQELTEGMCNAAWRLEGSGSLSQGIILKAGPSAGTEMLTYEKDKLRTEIRVYQLLEKKEIPTPRLLAWDISRTLVPCDYFFVDLVPGATWKSCLGSIPAQNIPDLMKQLGRCNAAVHSVEGEWFGYIKEDTRFRFDTWGKAFTAMMTDILNDGRQRGYALPYEEITHVLDAHRRRLDAVKTPRLVDFDMWAGNVFVNAPECTRITGVIDFEQCFYGDPFADFTSAVSLFQNVSQEQDFLAGYSEIGSPLNISADDEIRMDLYRLYMTVILFVEAYRFDEGYATGIRKYCYSQMDELIKRLA